jgi:hypothetical protein
LRIDSPTVTSSPTLPTFRPIGTGAVASIRSPEPIVFSTIKTASAPSGMGAPVTIVTQCPRVTRSSGTVPGIEVPTTSRGMGL